jgi:YD repeat-containing protein
MLKRCWRAGPAMWLFAGLSAGQPPAKVDFARDVQPILREDCFECHGPSQQMRGLRLDRRRDAMPNRVGANGARVVPGNSVESLLYRRVSGTQSGAQMPRQCGVGTVAGRNPRAVDQYDALGYLTRVVNPNGKTAAALTYDRFGHVATRTDSEGYIVNFTYDALDRPTQETYPDGATRQYTWDKLDLASVTDRQGRTTKYSYDAVRNLVAITDPLGRQTKFEYYENGKLKSLTDPNGNKTSWDIDLQSRVTAKHYADGSQVTYTYEATSSRLKSVTDDLGQVKQYSYTGDDQIAGTAYANAVNPTPNVSFAYDPFFRRVVSMTDGAGTTQYAYQPAGSPGALHLLSEDGPYDNDTIVYQYDELGRVIGRTVDSSAETLSYDSLGRATVTRRTLGSHRLRLAWPARRILVGRQPPLRSSATPFAGKR